MRPLSGESFRSKLPDVGTTIFTVMSRRARELGALNLGQGFPDYPIDPRLTQLVTEAMAQGFNQYAPMEGVIDLRERIAQLWVRATKRSRLIRRMTHTSPLSGSLVDIASDFH
jgi:aspartate/methionine/tyrosine aminotransferase